MATTKLGRIQCVDGSRKYFALLELSESVELESDAMSTSMSIVLTDVGKKAWKGSLNSEFLRVHAQRTKCTVDKYVVMTLSCLTEPATSSCNDEQDKGSKYVCQVKELESGDAELTWKRQLVDDDISVKLGAMTLRASDLADSLRTILAFGVSRIRELEKLTKEQQILEETHAQERKTILEKLNTCVTSKEQMERDLYAKFVAVLNEKKAEIRRLSSESVKTVVEVKVVESSTTKKSAKRIVEHASQSDPDDLSDEIGYDSQTPIVGRRKRPPTRSRLSDDLLLNDDDDVKRPVTRRINHKRSIKSAAPAAAVKGFAATSQAENSCPSTSKAPRRSKKVLAYEEHTFDSGALIDDM